MPSDLPSINSFYPFSYHFMQLQFNDSTKATVKKIKLFVLDWGQEKMNRVDVTRRGSWYVGLLRAGKYCKCKGLNSRYVNRILLKFDNSNPITNAYFIFKAKIVSFVQYLERLSISLLFGGIVIVLLLSQNKFIPQALEFSKTAVYKTIFRTGLGLKYKG